MVSSFFSRSKSQEEPSAEEARDDASSVTPSKETVDRRHAVSAWRKELDRVTRSFVEDPQSPRLDLTYAHPGGMAQFFAERTTRLSLLVREPGDRDRAHEIVRRLVDRSREVAAAHGVAPIHICFGRASWNAEDGRITSPMLLRPVEFEIDSTGEPTIRLTGRLFVAPDIAQAAAKIGQKLDQAAIVKSANQEHGFTVTPALKRLNEVLSGSLPGFESDDSMVVGQFQHPAQVLVDELQEVDLLMKSDIVRALAGDEGAAGRIKKDLPEPNPYDRDPWQERGIGDQLPEQLDQVEAVAAGVNVLFDTSGGADPTATLASIVVDAAASNKKVLSVTADKNRNDRLWKTLDKAGLSHAVARVDGVTHPDSSLVTALEKIFKDDLPVADRDAIEMTRTQLRRVRERLASHTEELHRPFEQWGVSAYDALQVLTDLTSTRPGPRTRVRLPGEVLTRLAQDSEDQAKAALRTAVEQGMFTKSGKQDPWFGVVIASEEQVDPVLERIQRLSQDGLPTLRVNMSSTASQTGLTPAKNFQEWEEQLRMLDGIREALDVFQPAIFERSAADMVIATASKQWRREHGYNWKRRQRVRLTKQAKDLLRPGRYVEDLHEELRKVQKQREIWRQHCDAGGWPKLPSNLDEMTQHATGVREDLEKLNSHLATAHGNLTRMDIGELSLLMDRMNADRSGAHKLPERIETLQTLHQFGLDDLVKDLRERNVPGSLVEKELDLAWWASALGVMLTQVPSLGGFDPANLQSLIVELKSLDQEQVESLALVATDKIRRNRVDQMARHYDEEKQLRNALQDGHLPHDSALTLYASSQLTQAIFPIVLSAPVMVPSVLPLEQNIDLLVIDGINYLPLSELIPLIARAKQLVVTAELSKPSITVDALRPLLAVSRIQPRPVRVNEYVGRLFNRYHVRHAGVPVPVPRAGSKLSISYVDGRGMPAPDTTAVESSSEEVEAVTDLVIEHALTQPEVSLAVVTLNDVHAERLRENLASTVATSPALESFFRPDKPEPFEIIAPNNVANVRRDRVILSVGYAKTPHGRVLHDFGEISREGGLEKLATILGSAGEDLHIVAAVHPGQFDRDRFASDGPKLLLDLMSAAEGVRETSPDDWPTTEAQPDQLLIDLADRLYNVGLTVIPNAGVEGSLRVPLAIGHPGIPDELLVAVLTDDDAYVSEPSLRRRDRYWPSMLEEHGWKTRTELSMAVFIDPQKEANAIVDLVLDAIDERIADDPVLAARFADADAAAEAAESGGGPESSGESGSDSGDGVDSGEGAGSGEAARSAGSEDGDEGSLGDSLELEDSEETFGTETAAQRQIRIQADEDIHGTAEEVVWRPSDDSKRAERPPIAQGLPLAAYSDDQLDEMANWIRSDGEERSEDEMVQELIHALGLTRRGAQVDAVLRNVSRRTAR